MVISVRIFGLEFGKGFDNCVENLFDIEAIVFFRFSIETDYQMEILLNIVRIKCLLVFNILFINFSDHIFKRVVEKLANVTFIIP